MAPGNSVFETRPTRIAPLGGAGLVARMLFPSEVHLGRARASRPSPKVAFLVHGLAMNEEYFGLVVPELLRAGYDVWALRLPGYHGAGRPASLRDLHLSSSLGLYGWVVASAMRHVACALQPRPGTLLAWGHSLGAAALLSGIAAHVGREWPGPDRLVLEAPAFPEAIAFPASMVAAFSAAPTFVLDSLARALLLDDLQSSDFARRQGTPLVPGRTNRAVFTMNVLSITHPFARTACPSAEWLERAWFVVGTIDRLVDPDRLSRLLDEWRVAPARRLLLARNHLLSLTAAREIVRWIESGGAADPRDGDPIAAAPSRDQGRAHGTPLVDRRRVPRGV